ncbi:DUF488 domain-containing protein [bacterium]|nr:DUF488 domain-containing protein [candidate division CSSED10-310 bacterium]
MCAPNIQPHTENSEPKSITVYTLGHSILQPFELVKLLLVNHIEIVIDIRSIPYSRSAPQFNKKNLENLLTESGFEYRFGGAHLGAFPDGKKSPSGATPDWNALAQRDAFKHGIKRVLQLASSKRTVLLCAEENPYRCHRHFLIAPVLLAQGVKIIHLRHNGEKIEVHKIYSSPKRSQRQYPDLKKTDPQRRMF